MILEFKSNNMQHLNEDIDELKECVCKIADYLRDKNEFKHTQTIARVYHLINQIKLKEIEAME